MAIDPSIFRFTSEDVTNAILRDTDLNLVNKTIEAIDYILNSLPIHHSFSNVQEVNYGYYWSRYLIKDIDIIIRRHNYHVTLYTRSIRKIYDMDISIYNAYMLTASIKEDFYDLETEVFNYLDAIETNIIDGVKNQKSIKKIEGYIDSIFRFVKNEYCFLFSNKINSIDYTLFALEELSNAYFRSVWQNTNILNRLQVDQLLPLKNPIYKITAIHENRIELLDIKRSEKETITLRTLLMYYSDYLCLEDI